MDASGTKIADLHRRGSKAQLASMSPPRDPLSSERLYALAETFLYAEAAGTLVQPPSISDGLTLDDAYRIGAAIARSRVEGGWRFRGWKVGFTNRQIWSKWGLDQPIVGPVYAETVFDAGADGGGELSGRPLRVPAGRRAALMIEVEVVFGFDGAAATGARAPKPDWVALGAELVDCHYRGWRLHPADAVADFGLHAGLAVGPRIAPVAADEVAGLRDIAVSLSAGAECLAEGKGRAVLDGPANVLAELHGSLAERIVGYGMTDGAAPDGHPVPGGNFHARAGTAEGGPRGSTRPGSARARSRATLNRDEGYLVSTGTLTPLAEATIGTTYEVEADLLPSFSFSLV